MTKSNLGVVLLGSLGLVGACGSNSNPATTGPVMTPKACVDPTGPGCKIPVDDGSFVRWAGQTSDANGGGTSSAVVTYTPRKLCMAGTVDSGPKDEGWGAILIVSLAISATDNLVTPFDATALGVKQVRFTLEGPPLQGVIPQVVQLTSATCTQIPDCLTSFALAAAVTDAGTVTAKLTDFTQPDGSHSNTSLDPTLITSLQFYVPTLQGMANPYDFCVKDLALLGADGKELKP